MFTEVLLTRARAFRQSIANEVN